MVTIKQEIEYAILAQKRWADLDNRMRDQIGSSQEYDKIILRHSIQNQFRYRGNLVRFVVNDEYEYYRDLLKYSRDHLMLFPYHLSDFIITADCLRLLGIGRNQYIDIMNELKSTQRRFLGIGVNMRTARSMLPNKPDENVAIEPWWFVNAGYITEDDVRSMVTPNERSIIDSLISPDGLSNQILACDIDEAHVRSLYLKGLIYLDVPIYDDDYIVVPPLEGFVMNRVTGDYFETLLYKIFVSIDQNTTVQELANILKIDIKLVKDAVSMYCRLRFAHKKNIYIDSERCHPSWLNHLNSYKQNGINVSQSITESAKHQQSHISRFMNDLASVTDYDSGTELLTDNVAPSTSELVQSQKFSLASSPSILSPSLQNSSSQLKKIVLFYDSNLAAFLMMGNLSTELKKHAVTMFEVGKLSDEWVDSLLEELSKIKGDSIDEDGYEAKRYYIHALMLHRTIEYIRTDLDLASDLLENKRTDEPQRVGLDLVRQESLSTLDPDSCERFLKKNYSMIISVAPLNYEVELSATSGLPHLGPGSPLINSLWCRLFIYHLTGQGPPSLLLLQGFRLEELPEVFKKSQAVLINHWNREPSCVSPNTALNAINDSLTHSPVLVQAYPIQPIGGNLINSDEKVFVPLPLMNLNDNSSSDTTGEKSNDPYEELERIPAIKKLDECIKLRRITGYITLLRSTRSVKKIIHDNETSSLYSHGKRKQTDLQPRESAVSDEELSSYLEGHEEYTIFNCDFGVPLFDRFLNKEVRTRMTKQQLCQANSLSKLMDDSLELNDKIQNFVDRYGSDKTMNTIDISHSSDQRHFFTFPDTKEFRCSVPRPAQNLIFLDGILSKFPPDEPAITM